MSELVNKVAEILNAPVDLVQRSAEARAAASGISVDDVLSSWAGGESVASSAPKEEAPVVEETAAEEVVEETPVEEVIEEAPVEEIKEVSVSSAVTRQVTKSLSFANETMGIKINSENLLPKWLNFSFIIIPLFILVGLISSSNTQDCGERGMLNIDRKSQEAVNCDGSPYEGKGVAATNTINYIAIGQEVYAGAAACAGCHGGGGGGGVGPAFIGGALYTTFPTCADHTKWIQLGSAGWQAEVGPTYGAEETVSIGGMPGFQGKLTEDELYAVVVFERVVFGGGNTEEVLRDCGLLETDEEEVTTEAVSSNP
ncbi:MAG: c-type cytochrome [Candidatus Actinomarinaceae bacterium]|tara:strand:+ start:1541 stop:2479 length:939 start_codon:yes stop_codon:yes gene_type:complete